MCGGAEPVVTSYVARNKPVRDQEEIRGRGEGGERTGRERRTQKERDAANEGGEGVER